MSTKISKQAIFEKCVEKQEDVINNFKSRVEEARSDAFSHNQSASQTEDRTSGKVEMLSILERELAFVQSEMNYLSSLNLEKEYDTIEPGAVVITDQRNFFISISIEKFEIEGQQFFGLSTKAPIYAAMQGKTKGENFEFNGMAYKIEDIY